MNESLFNEVTLPKNYFEMSDEEKLDVCLGLMESIYEIVIKQSSPQFDKVELFGRILNTTIKHNEQLEEYEACAILTDIKKILNESTDNRLHKQ
jgi:hypothetical protein